MPTIPRLHTSLFEMRTLNCERAALCTSFVKTDIQKASLTVEAAVVLPLFLIAMLTLVSVIDINRVFLEHQKTIVGKAENLAIHAYTMELSDLEPIDTYIDLYQIHNCSLAVNLIPGYSIKLATRGRIHPWTGRSETECAKDKEDRSSEIVYVTEYGTVYHTNAGCRYLDLTIYAVAKNEVFSKRNKDGSRYGSCSFCSGSADVSGVYYISPYGESYHVSQDCSGLHRNVRMVRKETVDHLPCCSKCLGG